MCGGRAQLRFQHAARVQRRAHKHLHQPPVLLAPRLLLRNRRARISVIAPVPAALGQRGGGRIPAAAVRWSGAPRRGGGARKGGGDAARQGPPGVGAHEAVGEIPVIPVIIILLILLLLLLLLLIIIIVISIKTLVE